MDDELRRLERASLADPLARAKLIQERFRRGLLTSAQVELAAQLGDPVARSLLPEEQRLGPLQDDGPRAIDERLEGLQEVIAQVDEVDLLRRFTSDCVARVLPRAAQSPAVELGDLEHLLELCLACGSEPALDHRLRDPLRLLESAAEATEDGLVQAALRALLVSCWPASIHPSRACHAAARVVELVIDSLPYPNDLVPELDWQRASLAARLLEPSAARSAAPNSSGEVAQAPRMSLPDASGLEVAMVPEATTTLLVFLGRGWSWQAEGLLLSLRDLRHFSFPLRVVVVTAGGVRANGLLRERLGLGFPLLADPDQVGAKAAGALGPEGELLRCAILYDREGLELYRWRSPTARSLHEGLEEAFSVGGDSPTEL